MTTNQHRLAELTKEAVERAAQLRTSLPVKVDLAMLTLNSKLPFKALALREILIHRFADLTSGASSGLLARMPISASLLTRGGMETFAKIYSLKNALDRTLINENLEELDEFLMDHLFGAKNREDGWPIAINIMKNINDLNLIIPNFRSVYNNLSEIAHPNYMSGAGTFQTIDRENHVLYFGDGEGVERTLTTAALSLIATQKGFEQYYNILEGSIRTLNVRFEEGMLKHS